MKRLFFAFVVIVLLAGCAGADIFPAIGSKMSNPITVAVDSATARLYVVNSDYKVSYSGGSVHVVDISDHASPKMVDYAEIPAFSGQVYVNVSERLLYMPNRAGGGAVSNLFRFNVDEESDAFLQRTTFTTGSSPYGIACCDASNRMFVVSQGGTIDYYLIDEDMGHRSLSLTTRLSTGVTISGSGALRAAIHGTQLIVTRASEGIWIIALDKLGAAGEQPIDYFIYDISSPRGVVSDGTYVYVSAVENNKPVLYVLDISSLAPRIGNSDTELVSREDDNILVASIELATGSNPQGVVVGDGAVYISDFDNGRVFVVDLATYAVSTNIQVGVEPYEMAIYRPAGVATHLAVANSGSNNISIIDLGTNKVIATYP